MSKSYVAKTKISFVEDAFYVNTGDILVHDPSNHNKLVVYRGGQIVKVMQHSPLKIMSMLKSKFIEEVTAATAPYAKPTSTLAPIAERLQKRKKAQAKEISLDTPEFRQRMGLDKEEKSNVEVQPQTLQTQTVSDS